MLRIAFGVTLLAAIACADAATLHRSHPYGELIDRGVVTARFSAGDGRLGCNPWVQVGRSGREVTIAALRLPARAPLELCAEQPSAVLGEFEAGWYAVLTYPILENPNVKRELLERTGEYLSVEVNGAFCYSPPPGDWTGVVREFHHAELDHYFYTANAAEIAGLDAGTGARGWVRTGKSFDVLVAPGCPPARHEQAAYRFFGKPGVGPSSHVFTVDREECSVVADSGAWLYEGAPFWATPPDAAGGCSRPGEIPLYRVWKSFGDSNHRFTTERTVVEAMTAKGWVDEGIAMCVRRS